MTTHGAQVSPRRDILAGLAQVLTAIGGRLSGDQDQARQIAFMAARAEEVAAQAWALANTRYPVRSAASELAAALEEFVRDATMAAESAARESAATRAVGAVLHGQAEEMNRIVREFDSDADLAVIRPHLRAVLATLVGLPARLTAVTAVAADVVALAVQARALGEAAEGLREAGRTPGVVAVALYRGLRSFAESADTVATAMAADAESIRTALASMTERTSQLLGTSPAQPAIPACAIGRLETVVLAGAPNAPRMLWGRSMPTAPRRGPG